MKFPSPMTRIPGKSLICIPMESLRELVGTRGQRLSRGGPVAWTVPGPAVQENLLLVLPADCAMSGISEIKGLN